MGHYAPPRLWRAAFTVLALTLLIGRAGRADALTHYTAQVFAQQGDGVGDLQFTRAHFILGQLNDNDQLAHVANVEPAHAAGLIQYSGGRITPVVLPGGPAPDGTTWPNGMGFYVPFSMNEAGDIVFCTGGGPNGVWLWDSKAQSVTPVALKGMPAVNGRTFEDAGGSAATINNRGEIAFTASVKNAMNTSHAGVFMRGQHGRIQGVALPDDPLPGQGGILADALNNGDEYGPSINDAGVVSFAAVGKQGSSSQVYRWEKGAVSVVADADTDIPGFGKLFGGLPIGGNNKNGAILITVQAKENGPTDFFLWNNGQFTPVAVDGQEMPGGGKYDGTISPDWGFANDAGQYPFVVQVNDNGVTHTAAYLVDATGTVSPVLKVGMTTELGTITDISSGFSGPGSYGIGLNNKGQIALTARIDNDDDVVLLLTPKTP